MDTWIVILIAAVVIAAALVAWMLLEKRRSAHLRARFGPEYQRAIQEMGDRRRAEAELQRREKRVEHLHIHPLPPAERDRFAEAWHADQALFVDDPKGAVLEADRLLVDLMKARGYPVADFDQRVEDISVDHAHLVQNYLAAREIVARHKRGEAGTEDLRKAMVLYRALFDELLEVQEVRR